VTEPAGGASHTKLFSQKLDFQAALWLASGAGWRYSRPSSLPPSPAMRDSARRKAEGVSD